MTDHITKKRRMSKPEKDPTDFLTLLTALAIGVAIATIIHSFFFLHLINLCK